MIFTFRIHMTSNLSSPGAIRQKVYYCCYTFSFRSEVNSLCLWQLETFPNSESSPMLGTLIKMILVVLVGLIGQQLVMGFFQVTLK